MNSSFKQNFWNFFKSMIKLIITENIGTYKDFIRFAMSLLIKNKISSIEQAHLHTVRVTFGS